MKRPLPHTDTLLSRSRRSCTENAAPAVDHPDYLVFDLSVDEAEATPVRPGMAVMDAIYAAHKAKLDDIANTFKSVTDYSGGETMIAAAPCCNPANAVCRCDPTGDSDE